MLTGINYLPKTFIEFRATGSVTFHQLILFMILGLSAMSHIKVRFVISELTTEEVEALTNNEVIISKMILTPDDFALFHYKEGDEIEVETEHGNRMWCVMRHREIISGDERVILIFTLMLRVSLQQQEIDNEKKAL